MKTELTMTVKEADRYALMRQLESQKISIKGASHVLGICYRQARRLWSRYQEEGPKGLISKRKGKPSNHQMARGVKEKAMALVKEKYADYGPTLATEKLQEKHSLILSKETLRQLMIQEGLWEAKMKKDTRIYARRTRRSCVGELIQIDGSYEAWFEDRAEKCCLLVCIDDATSRIMKMRFCRTETTDDYFELVKDYLNEYGRPKAFYSDKHGVFRVNMKGCENHNTSFHRALKELDIELICAHSPQAKGRVERANGILQDRFIKELREEGISSMEEGNAFLETYLKKHNKKFEKEPANENNAHRALLPSHNLETILLEKSQRVIS
ncbi:MAG: ISNCY family transposase, partial [Chlamydiota bacterium]